MIRSDGKQKTLGVILSYAAIAAELVSGLLYTPIVLKLLGQSQYGIYSLVISFTGYLTIFNAGANAAYIRFYVQMKETDRQKVDGLNGLFLLVFTVIAAIGVGLGLLIAQYSPQLFGEKFIPQEYELVRKCFFLLSVYIGVSVFNSFFNSILIANEKFIFGKAINLLTTIALPLITAPLLILGHDCTVIIAVRIFVTASILVVNVLYCLKVLKTKYKLVQYSKELLQSIFWFMSVMLLNSVTDQLNWQIDKIILARTQGPIQISIYSVGATFNTIYMQLGMAVSGIFIAQVNRLVSRNAQRELDDLFVRISRLNMYITCLVMLGFTFFGKAFVLRWAGQEYLNSFLVGWLLMFPLTLTMTLGLQLEIGRAKNLHYIQIRINTILCIMNMLVSIPLAMKWGALGSALGTFITEVIVCFIVQPIYIWKVLRMDMCRVFFELIKVLPAMIIPAITGVLLNKFEVIKPDFISIVFFGAIYTLVYIISIWIFAMNQDEKTLIKKIVVRR